MKTVKKYLIEFVVIVLGVSASFMTEQWRQSINSRQEIKELFDQAIFESRVFLKNDTTRQTSEQSLKKINRGNFVDADSLLLIVGQLEMGLDFRIYFTSIYTLGKKDNLTLDQAVSIKTLLVSIEHIYELNQGTKILVQNDLKPILDRYGALEDYNTLQESDIYFENPKELKIGKKGKYDLFSQRPGSPKDFQTYYIAMH